MKQTCSRCGGRSIFMHRDWQERPVCYGCIYTAMHLRTLGFLR